MIVCGDGREGYPQEAPYDVIHVGAAAAKVPEPLLQQLSVGGHLVIPVGPRNGDQNILKITKIDDQGNF